MVTVKNIGILVLLASLVASCGSFQRHGGEGSYRDSELSNLNPAPEAFQPPDMGSTENPVIDSVYLQTQSDFHYTLGEAFSLEGNSERAIEEFKLTLIYDPNSVNVRLRLAVEYVRQGLMSEAIEHAELAVKMEPQTTEGRLLLGGLYSSLKMYEEALKQYQAILEFEAKHEEARVYIGAILAEQKKYAESIRIFEELATLSPPDKKYQAYYYIGRIRSEQGGAENQVAAEKSFTKALSLNPKDVETVLALAKVYETQEKTKKLVELLESFQEKFGPNARVAQQLANVYLEDNNYRAATKQLEYLEGYEPDDVSVKFRLGLLYVEMKDFEKAIEKFEKVLEVEPDSDRSRFYLAAVYEELKRYDEAIGHFQQVPPSSSFFADATIHAAYLLKLKAKFDQAISVMEQAIAQRDDVPQFYAFYASLLDDKKAYSKAVKMLTSAVEKFPTHTQLLFFLGSMQDRLGNTDETIAKMKKVIEIDENHVQALNYLAYTYAEQNQNLGEAESLARKALSFQPKDGYILDTLGWILFKQNRVAEAISTLEAAFNEKSNESIIAEHLGDAYYKYELVEKARKMYMKAADIETDEQKAKKLRDKVVSIDRQIEEAKTRTPASSRTGK
ncbi:MAG: tetratricopeptide repeat protein [Bdellovibrionales bacterium]|nr:tetratricopeptide repeat protein [Bdellovibrionales bacterium]